VKLSTVVAAATATGLGMHTEEAQAISASLATLIVIDPVTLSYMIYGPCCHFCPDKLIVSHYQPVALCEVIKGGGDSALGPFGGLLSVGTDNNDYTSFHVRIWQLPGVGDRYGYGVSELQALWGRQGKVSQQHCYRHAGRLRCRGKHSAE
jgi:hypothetical protein